MQALKEKGYTSYKLRQSKLLAETTMTKLRNNNTKITLENLNTICTLLQCQPGDILEYVPNDEEYNKKSVKLSLLRVLHL